MSAADSIEGEVWRSIPGHGGYEASSHGRIRSCRRTVARVLALTTNCATGYKQVGLSGAGGKKVLLVHRLVAAAFHGRLQMGDVVNHRDRDRVNNHVANLEVSSVGMNVAHRDLMEWVRAAVRQELLAILPQLLSQQRSG